MRWERRGEILVVQAPAKLNLYLEVGPRRADGFHDIDSIFQAVTLHDTIEVVPTSDGVIRLEESGIAERERNLVYRAAVLLQTRHASRASGRGASLRLRKGIPEGAGLGGGSSDAAATLLALAHVWDTGLRPVDLLPLAQELGSDVPFFLWGGTARCRGRGEQVESWASVFDTQEAFHYVLVYPRIKVVTKLAYEALDAARGPGFALTPPSPLDSMPAVEAWAQLRQGKLFFNRFQDVVYAIFPELRKVHERLCEEPFLKVLMSGSGSTVYGLCRDAAHAERTSTKLRATLDASVFAVSSERCHGSFG